jgi:hypothetical protein
MRYDDIGRLGHIIIPICIIIYMGLYTYLCQEYGPIDE